MAFGEMTGSGDRWWCNTQRCMREGFWGLTVWLRAMLSWEVTCMLRMKLRVEESTHSKCH